MEFQLTGNPFDLYDVPRSAYLDDETIYDYPLDLDLDDMEIYDYPPDASELGNDSLLMEKKSIWKKFDFILYLLLSIRNCI